MAVANGRASLDSTNARLAWQHISAMVMPVEATTSAGREERTRVLRVLREHEGELRARGLTRLALFGSTARGDLGPGSDIDLLIEVEDDLARLLGRPVDLAFADAMRPRLQAAVLRDAVEVF